MIDQTSASRLSQSPLWDYQRAFFAAQGVAAWHHKVPFFVTSNPVIASHYAELVVAYMQHWRRQEEPPATTPFHIIDCGAGTGLFAFFFLKQLRRKLQTRGLADLSFRYVLTDIAEKNIEFWENHPPLQPFFEAGVLDTAQYDTRAEEPLYLRAAQHPLQAGPRPCILLANYFFDSLPTDFFRIGPGCLEEGWVSLVPTALQQPLTETAHKVPLAGHQIRYRPVGHTPYYSDPQLDNLLQQYQERLCKPSYVSLPVEGIRSLQRWLAWSDQRLLLVASDKAYTSIDALHAAPELKISNHDGACSVMVNFHALGAFVEDQGGTYLPPPPCQGLRTACWMLGGDHTFRRHLQETHRAWLQDYLSAQDYFVLHRYLKQEAAGLPFPVLLSYLKLSLGDPYVLHQIYRPLVRTLPQATYQQRGQLLDCLRDMRDNIYTLPGRFDAQLEINTLQALARQ